MIEAFRRSRRLRTALGVVLGMDGIDVRVRLYLWSGGVEDVTLPVVNARRCRRARRWW